MNFENGIVTFTLPSDGYSEELQAQYKGLFFRARAENVEGQASIKLIVDKKKPIFLQKDLVEKKCSIDVDALVDFEPYVVVRGETWEGFYVEGKLVVEAGVITASTFEKHIPGFKVLWLSPHGEKAIGSKMPASLGDTEDFVL